MGPHWVPLQSRVLKFFKTTETLRALYGRRAEQNPHATAVLHMSRVAAGLRGFLLPPTLQTYVATSNLEVTTPVAPDIQLLPQAKPGAQLTQLGRIQAAVRYGLSVREVETFCAQIRKDAFYKITGSVANRMAVVDYY